LKSTMVGGGAGLGVRFKNVWYCKSVGRYGRKKGKLLRRLNRGTQKMDETFGKKMSGKKKKKKTRKEKKN